MGCHDEPCENDINIVTPEDRATSAELKKELDELKAKITKTFQQGPEDYGVEFVDAKLPASEDDSPKAAENFEQFKDGLGDYAEENKRANEGYNSNEVKYDTVAAAPAHGPSDWQLGYDEGFADGYQAARDEMALKVMRMLING